MELKKQFNLPKYDYGIDLISKKDNNYYTIQCKYKNQKIIYKLYHGDHYLHFMQL